MADAVKIFPEMVQGRSYSSADCWSRGQVWLKAGRDGFDRELAQASVSTRWENEQRNSGCSGFDRPSAELRHLKRSPTEFELENAVVSLLLGEPESSGQRTA